MNLVALPEAAKVVMGQSPPSSTYNTKGKGLPFFQGKADFGDLYPTARVFCTEPQRIAEAGDILMSVRAPVGPTNLNPHRSCIGRGLAAIRPIVDTDTKYLLYFLRYHEPELAKAGTGSTFEAVSRDDIEDIKVPLPPLPEQQRIAGILARADRLRRLRRYALELSEGYLQAVFVEMFGDPVRNPKGWKRAKVADLGEVQTGNTPPREQAEYYGDHIEWIKSDNILDDQMYLSHSREQLSEEGLKQGRVVDSGALLVTCIAGSLSSVGGAALTNRRVAFNQQINAVTPRRDVNSLFLYGMFRIAQPFVQQNASAGVKHILTKSKLEELTLIKPPLSLQGTFSQAALQYERLRAQQREAARQAEQLFGALLDRAFRGEL